jgi:hypothetical protein
MLRFLKFYNKSFVNIWSTRQLCAQHIYEIHNQNVVEGKNDQDDEDISDEVIDITKKTMTDTLIENKIQKLVMHASLSLKLKHLFNCSEAVADKMINQDKKLLYLKNTSLAENIKFLFEHQISTKTIIENPWLLSAKRGNIMQL